MANTQSTVTGRTADAAHFSGNPLVTVARAMAIAVSCGAAIAQCATTIHGSGSLPGVDGPVWTSLEWDPDGSGPATPVLVVGGSFRAAGSIAATNIAVWDPATSIWSALGEGLANGDVRSLAVLPNGELVAGGAFSASGNTTITRVARWNGTTWQSLGGGTPAANHWVADMVTLPNGDLVVGGFFQGIGGSSANHVARWDGSTWNAIGGSLADQVDSLAVLPNGDLVAAGLFSNSLSPTGNIARWNGTNWVPLGVGLNSYVEDLAVDAGGNLVAVGGFSAAGGAPANHVASWNGTSWSSMGAGLDGAPRCVAVRGNGQVLAGGTIPSSGGAARHNLVAWTGSNWVDFGTAAVSSAVLAISELGSGDVIASGAFSSSTPPLRNIGRWDGSAWSTLGTPISSPVLEVLTTAWDLLADRSGSLVVVGSFSSAGGLPIAGIARWSGTQWSAVGNGTFIGTGIYRAVQLPNGDLVVGGDFSSIGGVLASNVARWNGSVWSPLGSGTNAPVLAMTALAGGDLVVGGYFTTAGGTRATRTARWNGSAWSALGNGPGTINVAGQAVRSLVELQNGDLLAGGSLLMSGGSGIARWDGSTWNACGSLAGVNCLLRTEDNSVFAAGDFPFPSQSDAVHQWTGSNWTPVTSPLSGFRINSLLRLQNGDLLAGGLFAQAGATPVQNLARWNGSTWSAIGNGVRGYNGSSMLCMAAFGDRIIGGGDFTLAGNEVGGGLAEITSSCPGGFSTVGNGCASSGGTNTLAARSQPWLGSTLKTRTTGAPATGFALVLTGVTSIPQGAAPLSVLPQGVPGCDVLVQPDIDAFVAIAAGTADWSIFVPVLPALLGLSVDQQMILIDATPAAFGLLTASNSLRITIGQF